MGLDTIGFGTPLTTLGVLQTPWALSPQLYGGQSPFAMTPYSGFNPYAAQPFQQIGQLFQIVPQQLQQLLQLEYLEQHQLQQLQLVLQLIPAQLAQLQQLIQVVPQHIQRLQQPWGVPSQLFSAQPGYVM